MAFILSIETATMVCSVALHNNGKLVDHKTLHLDKSHSERLAPLIKQLLTDNKINLHQLSAIAISSGPGSYTGLRIGSSTSKGLCYALKIPLIAVNTLEAMAHQVKTDGKKQTLLCPMIDARRMEVYCLLQNGNYEEIVPTKALVVDQDTFNAYLDSNEVVFFGNGASKCSEVIKHNNAIFKYDIYPSAVTIGEIAYQKFLKKTFEEIAYFEPYYLKKFITTQPKPKAV